MQGFFFKVWHHWSDPDMLVKYTLTQFSKALELLEKQTAKKYHQIAVVRAEEFLQVMKGQQYIYQHLDQAVSDQ